MKVEFLLSDTGEHSMIEFPSEPIVGEELNWVDQVPGPDGPRTRVRKYSVATVTDVEDPVPDGPVLAVELTFIADVTPPAPE